MKRILLIIAMVLVTSMAFAQKFGRVSSTELIQLCPEADQARATLQAASKEAQETYTDMTAEYGKKYEAYQQNAAKWAESTRTSKEKELYDFQQRIQEYSQSVQQELQQKEQSLFQPIMEKATKVISDIAAKAGYVAVFEEGSLPYVDKTQCVDITPEARKAMGIKEGRTLESLAAELQQAQAAPEQAK